MKHSHVFMRFPGGLSKALSFTFDDGSEQDERLVGLLAENGLLATFNLNMGLLPPDDSFDFSTLDRAVFPAADWCQRRMSRAAIGRVFAESGMELACHGYLHADLSKLDDEGVLWEIMRDRAALEELTGESVRGFAYPQGAYDDRRACAERGIRIRAHRGLRTRIRSAARYDGLETELPLRGGCRAGAVRKVHLGGAGDGDIFPRCRSEALYGVRTFV